MTLRKAPENRGEFQPADFWMIFEHLPQTCSLAGGQAVAWWAIRYGIVAENSGPITSEDIDFWGGREELVQVARALKLKPIFPNPYEMTVWSGAIELEIDGKQSLADFLHTVPGLEVVNPSKASAEQDFLARGVARRIKVLTPISLMMAKLHCLRHFPQEGRNDELHLRVCLRTASAFLSELLDQKTLRQVFWNIERIVSAHQFKPYRRLQASLGFNVLEAVPIEELKGVAEKRELPAEDGERLNRFLEQRWPQVLADDQTIEQE